MFFPSLFHVKHVGCVSPIWEMEHFECLSGVLLG